MTDKSTVSDIIHRINTTTEALAARLKQAAGGVGMPAGHEEKAQDLNRKAEAIRDKLPESGGSVWDGIAHEVERDVLALENDFDHWVGYLDKHFEDQNK